MTSWSKYLAYDWDPELFGVFLRHYPLQYKHLISMIRHAVNHDRNIEAVVEQGLSLLDDIDDADINNSDRSNKDTRTVPDTDSKDTADRAAGDLKVLEDKTANRVVRDDTAAGDLEVMEDRTADRGDGNDIAAAQREARKAVPNVAADDEVERV